MNGYAILILAALLLDYFLNLAADLLNLRSLRNPLPPEVSNWVDGETWEKTRSYTTARTRFGLLAGTVHLAALLLFWFAGGFNALDQLVRSLQKGPIATGILFITTLLILRSLLSLPFRIWSTFVIEERFGFNRTDLKTFTADLLKSFLLSVLIGIPLLAGILAFFEYGGPWAWAWAWLAVTLFTLLIQFIAPAWIMPLFNKFEPLPDGELRQRIREYAASVQFPLRDIHIMDGSRRSSKSNAFFTGFGKNKRIALFDTLVENHTTDELVAILAHEIGHFKLRHIPKNLLLGILHTGVLLLLLSLFLNVPGLFEAFYMEETGVHSGLVFFGLLYAPVELLLSIFLQALSRKYEFEADAFAARTTKDPQSMEDALKKLSRDNLSNLVPHPLYVCLHASHPPVTDRVRALRALSSGPE